MRYLFVHCILALVLLAGCQSPNQNEMTATAPTQGNHQVAEGQTPLAVPLTQTAPPVQATQTLPATATLRPSPTLRPTLADGQIRHPPGPVEVPILLYHRIRSQGNTRYILPVSEFRAQVKALHQAGYQSVTISQVAQVMRAGGVLPEKPVVITFDDGYLDIYENAFPILEEYGFTAVVYIITGTVGTDLSYGYMQAEELKELVKAGWEIGSHSVSHTNLAESRLGIRAELRDSKQTLEDLLEIKILSFSYPYAITNDWIKKRVEEYGYTSAVGVGLPIRHTPEHLYYLSRREVYRGTSVRAFLALLEPEAGGEVAEDGERKTPSPAAE